MYEGVTDAGVTVRVVLHGLSDDVCHFVVSAIVDALHGMEDTPLHGLESVVDIRNGSFEDDIGGIVEEPVLIHTGEVVLDAVVEVAERDIGV